DPRAPPGPPLVAMRHDAARLGGLRGQTDAVEQDHRFVAIEPSRRTEDVVMGTGRGQERGLGVFAADGWGKPQLHSLKSVVFPAPFGPMMARRSPSGTARSTPFTPWPPPKCFRRPPVWRTSEPF